MITNAIMDCRSAGTDLVEVLVIKWLGPVTIGITVVRTGLDGSMGFIPQWMMGLFNAESVSVIMINIIIIIIIIMMVIIIVVLAVTIQFT